MSAKILIIDDEKVIRRILSQTLQDAGYSIDAVSSVAEARSFFDKEIPDLILLDYKLPDGLGLDVLKFSKVVAPNIPVVMITAHASLAGAVQAVKEGVYDYISKPFEEEELLQTIARALETGRLRHQVARHQEETQKTFGLQNIAPSSSAMMKVKQVIDQVAASGATTVLLLGESGVGKGFVARALHFTKGHESQPFMHVTCTALTETLLESELFGHEKGAFTDARTDKKGLFELAHGGTVFLDEIGDIPPSLQAKLLRFLEEKTFRKVGGNREIKVNARVVAATNKDLQKEVEAGRFRSDLFFRLNVITIVIPPLRERKEDLFSLAEQFIRDFNQEFNKKIESIAPRAKECMAEYYWPGNVRELRNTLERAVLLSNNRTIHFEDLPEMIQKNSSVMKGNMGAHFGGSFELPPEGIVLEDLERDLVLQALKRTGGNHVQAARLLGMNRHQIRYRIEKFHMDEASTK